MNRDSVDNLVIFILVLTIILDTIALFIELFNRRCDKRAEQEKQRNEEKFNQELADLRQRIVILEKNIRAM